MEHTVRAVRTDSGPVVGATCSCGVDLSVFLPKYPIESDVTKVALMHYSLAEPLEGS